MPVLIREAKHLAKQTLGSVQTCREYWRRGIRRSRIQRILGQGLPHRHYDEETIFDRLQAKYPGLGQYAYDPYSCWERAAERAGRLIRHLDIKEPGCRVLEVGCGDGTLGVVLNGYGHDITLCDLEDWREPRAHSLPFVQSNASEHIDIPHGQFDLICSYNSFEHISDPAAALGHLVPLLRPEGRIYLEFGPLYAGPWGLHAFYTLLFPYPQFIFSPQFIDDKLDHLGIYTLGKKSTSLQPLNRWRLHQYEQLWDSCGCTIDHCESGIDDSFLDLILQFPHAFSSIDLKYEDLVTQHIAVTLRKNAVPSRP